MAELSLYSLNENKLDKNSTAVAAEKIINDSGTFTIEKSVPSNAVFLNSNEKTKLNELNNVARIETGLFEDRPANNPDNPGLIYISIDKNDLRSYDTGTEWINLNENYKVGDIYITTHGVNPTDFFGYGTWEEFGQGRVLVGVDTHDSNFANIENEGGEKNVILDETEMPAHNHSGWTTYNGEHNHDYQRFNGDIKTSAGGGEAYHGSTHTDEKDKTGVTDVDGDHRHEIYYSGGDADNITQAHNNLQPYIIVRMWKRIS